jgi:hypothetical protein
MNDFANFGTATFSHAFARADDDRGYCPQELTYGGTNAVAQQYTMSLLTCGSGSLARTTPGCLQTHGADLSVVWQGWR